MNAAEPGQEFQGSLCGAALHARQRALPSLPAPELYTHTHTQCTCNGQLLERRQICVLLCYTSLHIGRQSATDVYMCVQMNMCAYRQICVLLCYASLHIRRQSATDVYMRVRMNTCASVLHITPYWPSVSYRCIYVCVQTNMCASLLHITPYWPSVSYRCIYVRTDEYVCFCATHNSISAVSELQMYICAYG